MQKYYTLYEVKKAERYEKFEKDLDYIKEYNNIEEIQKEFNLKNKRSVYHYIVKNIDNLNSYKNLLDNKYILIKE